MKHGFRRKGTNEILTSLFGIILARVLWDGIELHFVGSSDEGHHLKLVDLLSTGL